MTIGSRAVGKSVARSRGVRGGSSDLADGLDGPASWCRLISQRWRPVVGSLDEEGQGYEGLVRSLQGPLRWEKLPAPSPLGDDREVGLWLSACFLRTAGKLRCSCDGLDW